jgi:hypothetical protein
MNTQANNRNRETYVDIHDPAESTWNVGLGNGVTGKERYHYHHDTSKRRSRRFSLEAGGNHSEECLHGCSHGKNEQEEDAASAFSETQ